MLGLGESHDEIIDTMYDLRDAVSPFSIPSSSAWVFKHREASTLHLWLLTDASGTFEL